MKTSTTNGFWRPKNVPKYHCELTLLLPFSFYRWHQVSSPGHFVFLLLCSPQHGFNVDSAPCRVSYSLEVTGDLGQLQFQMLTLQQAFTSFFLGTFTVSLRLSSRAICNLRSSPRLRRSSWSGTMELEAGGNVDSHTAGHKATVASNRKGPASCGISRENIVQRKQWLSTPRGLTEAPPPEAV